MDIEYLSRVLQYINAVRERYGLPLLAEIPKGASPNNSESELGRDCPLARAIPGIWVSNTYVLASNGRLAVILSAVFEQPAKTIPLFPDGFVIHLPEVLIEFVDSYNRQSLPQFVDNNSLPG